MQISKTAALKTARQAVSRPVGRRTSWQVYGPYRATELDGPTTTGYEYDYFAACARRTRWVAYIALILMGYEGDDLCEVDMIAEQGGSVESIVNAYIRNQEK